MIIIGMHFQVGGDKNQAKSMPARLGAGLAIVESIHRPRAKQKPRGGGFCEAMENA
ncbi:hypothetical protein [Sinimarinibacterium sp. NLF-5-8]|uniref:hypothetical protein n=1 Tax=Sinimarinibacterium sp. NLF-5-8 TaxID=2698684 RepID=UPI00137C2A8D|nr:hypothetical protein [Sinimarinibacterium sp. NLF-5-8]QHS11304.1 hypothetical protein GT972_14880 [Sinimarinibacterium sp. NLF-5-8]